MNPVLTEEQLNSFITKLNISNVDANKLMSAIESNSDLDIRSNNLSNKKCVTFLIICIYLWEQPPALRRSF